LFHSIIATNQ